MKPRILSVAIASLLAGLMSPSMRAQDEIPAMYETGVDTLITSGSGYDATTGAVRRAVVDLQQVAVPGLPPLAIRRHHMVVKSIVSNPEIGFEPFWGMKYTYNLQLGERVFDFWSASGRRIMAINGGVIYPEDIGVNEQFEGINNPDGTKTVIMLKPNGERIAFQSIGTFVPNTSIEFRMIWLDDANGRRTIAEHTDGDSFVDKLIDPTGRWIAFQGLPTKFGGRVTHALSSDGQWVSYTYDSGGCQIAYSDGTTASYTKTSTSTTMTLTFSDVRPSGSMPTARYNLIRGPVGAGSNWIVSSVTHPATSSVVSTRTFTGLDAPQTPGTVTETRGDGPARTFQVGGNYELGSATDFTGNVTQVSSSSGLLWSTTDARGYPTSYQREGIFGNITRITYPGGAYKEWTYTDNAKPFFVWTYRDELGRVTTYDRFGNGIIGQANYPDGSTEGWGGLTALLQPTIHRFRNGINEGFVYETTSGQAAYGQLKKQWVLDVNGNWAYAIDYTYYPDGDPWEGRLKTVKDPRGNVTTYEYDMLFVNGEQSTTTKCSGRGLVTKIIYADGTTEKFKYDVRGNKLEHTDQLAKTTVYTYDDYNRLRTVTVPVSATDSRVTTYTYEHTNFSTNPMTHTANKPGFEITDSGKTKALEYDANFRLKKEIPGWNTPDAVTTTYGYDSVGNQNSVTDGMGRVTTFQFDNRNRRSFQFAPLSRTTEWQYDDVGNVTKVINPDGTYTSKSYDSMNRVWTSTDEMLRVTSYSYWPSGKVNTITDPRGKVYQQLYDPYERIKERKYPVASGSGYGASERWEYDGAGNVSKYFNRSGSEQRFTYNNLNRETNRFWFTGTGPNVSTGYDLVGRVLWQTNQNGRLDYLYDYAGGVTKDMQTNTGGPTVTLWPSYNADGERSVVWTSAGTWLGYEYNNRHALKEIQQWGGAPITWATFSYNAAGERRYRTDYNGVQSEFNYDGAGRTNLLHITLGGGSWILKQTGGRDLRDRRTWTVRDDNYGDAYSYYNDSQVNQYRNNILRPDLYPGNPATWTDTFNYDAGGNRATWADNTSTKTYSVDNLNQYTAVSGATITHTDGRGNITRWNEWYYVFDAENRLTRVYRMNPNLSYDVYFYYDAAGRLMRLNRNGAWEYRYYDGSNVFLRTQANGTWIDFTIWGPRPNEVVSRYSASSSWIFYQQDFLGGTSTITNLGGGVVERYLYDAYGRELLYNGSWQPIVSSPTSNPWTYTGQEFMADIGLNNYKNRFYHSTLGRFIQNDPIRFGGGDLNLYRYVGNNPINSVDPTGLWTVGFGFQGSYTLFGHGGARAGFFFGRSDTGKWSASFLSTGYGGGGLLASADVGGFVAVSTAQSVDELRGPSIGLGVSGSKGAAGAGVDVSQGGFISKDGKLQKPTYTEVQLNVGLTAGLPVEGHIAGSGTGEIKKIVDQNASPPSTVPAQDTAAEVSNPNAKEFEPPPPPPEEKEKRLHNE